MTFGLADAMNGPFPSAPAPRYYPTEVFPTLDDFPGVSAHTEADSRSEEQVAGIANRNYINSRPAAGTDNVLYVVSWLAGPDRGGPPDPMPSQEEIDGYPARSIRVFKITY